MSLFRKDITQRPITDLIRGKELGSGSYARVYLATDKRTKNTYALKVLNNLNDKEATDGINREAEVMLHLHHENIMR